MISDQALISRQDTKIITVDAKKLARKILTSR